jgi:hypothetical protein
LPPDIKRPGPQVLARVCAVASHPWPLSQRTVAVLASLLFFYGACIVYLGALHTSLFGHDYFIFLDGGWRILTGQRPHIDFHTAMGPIQALYSAFAMRVAGRHLSTGFGIARALVTAGLTLWGFLLLRGRIMPGIAIAMCTMLALTAGAPYALSSPPLSESMAMFYNRFGYALLILIILEGFRPSKPRFGGGLSTGVAAALLLFLKISFFGVSLGFLSLSLLVKTPRSARLTGIFVGFVLVTGAFLGWLHFDLPAIVHDLQMGATARSTALPFHRLLRVLAASFPGMLITLILGAVTSFLARDYRLASSYSLWPAALALLAVVSEPVVAMTNQQDTVFILLSACSLLFAAVIATLPTGANRLAQELIGAVIVIALSLPLEVCTFDLAGFLWAMQHNLSHSTAAVTRIDAPWLSSLIFEGTQPGDYKFENGPPFVEVINDGLRVLRANTASSDRVLTLGFINPFPVCLRRPSPRGASTWFSLGMNISKGNFIPASELFAEAEAVMVPRYADEETPTTLALVKQYNAVLQQSYELKAETPFWSLYTKRPGKQ